MYVDRLFPLKKPSQFMFGHVTTHYQTVQAGTGHNAIRYHNSNSLPHLLPYIFSQFSMVWDYFQWVSTR